VWSRYLFFRSNPVGAYTERWVHVHGCRRYVTLTRDTLTHQITGAHFRGTPVEDRR
jgi:heterotetrameric sarcosine oxidase delta subunit